MRPRDLVALHGQPGLGSDWERVLARLPESVRAIAPDRPGYGSSAARGAGLEPNAAAVIGELDARGIDRAVLVGHSYGGGVALKAAVRAPHRVEALVLLAAVGPDCLNGWDALLAAPVAGPVCAFCAFALTPGLARASLRLLAHRRNRPEVAEADAQEHVNLYVWGHARWKRGPLWRTFLAEQRALVREAAAIGGLASSLRVPTLILADPADTVVPFRTAQTLASLMPRARLVPVEGAGHHLPLRMPERVAAEITRFLESLDDPAGGRSPGGLASGRSEGQPA